MPVFLCIYLFIYLVTVVTYRDRRCRHTPCDTGEETAQEQHPEVRSPPEQHVSKTQMHSESGFKTTGFCAGKYNCHPFLMDGLGVARFTT